jgi:hypothetical protein
MQSAIQQSTRAVIIEAHHQLAPQSRGVHCTKLVRVHVSGLGIRGTHLKSSIQDIVDEVAPIKKAPLWG